MFFRKIPALYSTFLPERVLRHSTETYARGVKDAQSNPCTGEGGRGSEESKRHDSARREEAKVLSAVIFICALQANVRNHGIDHF